MGNQLVFTTYGYAWQYVSLNHCECDSY